MKTKYITIPVLSVITALSLSSVAHAICDSPQCRDWYKDTITYNCNGHGENGRCLADHNYAPTAELSETYSVNTALVTPRYNSKSNKFIGWKLKTYRYHKIDNDHCAIFVGVSKRPVTKMPSKIGEFDWDLFKQYDSEYFCNTYKEGMLPYSTKHLDDRISGSFLAYHIEEPYYTAELHLNGGIITGNVFKNTSGDVWTVQYTESDNFKLPTPTKQGYVFKGWCENPELTICPTPRPYANGFSKRYYAWWVEKKKPQPIQLQKAKQINSKILNSITVK